MKRLTVLLVLLALVGAATAYGSANDAKHCVTLLPKGGGTVVNGTFVKLHHGQVLLLCERTKASDDYSAAPDSA